MKTRITLLFTLTLLLPASLTGARSLEDDVAPVEAPNAVLCVGDIHLPVLCPYECSDGADNDGDGLVDYPADPSCTSAEEDNEGRCVTRTRRAQIYSTYSMPSYPDTFVEERRTWGYSCPGGPTAGSESYYCWTGPNWGETTGCPTWTPDWQSRGRQGTYTCYSFCTGTVSPHNLGAAVTVLDNYGNYLCKFKSTPGVPTASYCG